MSNSPSDSPLISVIIPVHNTARYLEEALESVRAQTMRDLEIIVVDDGSTDESAQIAKRGGDVRYFYQNRAGGGAARNAGVEQGRGEFVAFLDADDVWSSDKLSRQLSAWNDLPKTAAPTLIFAHAKQFFSPELSPESRALVRLPDAPQPAPVAGTLLALRADFLAIGPYNSQLGDVIDWFLRARESGAQIHILPDVLLFRRIHDSNMSRTQKSDKTEYARILKASLDRRRQAANPPVAPLETD